MMTFKELKQMVGESGEKKYRFPKTLKEEGTIVVKEILADGVEVSVFSDGYVLYEKPREKPYCGTIFPLHSCGSYHYESVEAYQRHKIPEEVFDQEPWYMRLILEGEDRIAFNNDRKQRSYSVSYDQESEEWPVLADPFGDVAEKVMRKIRWEKACEGIDETQWKNFIDVYLDKTSYSKLGKELGIDRRTLADMIKRTKEKIECMLIKEMEN